MVVVSDIVRNGIRKKAAALFLAVSLSLGTAGCGQANNPAETQSPGRIQDPDGTQDTGGIQNPGGIQDSGCLLYTSHKMLKIMKEILNMSKIVDVR